MWSVVSAWLQECWCIWKSHWVLFRGQWMNGMWCKVTSAVIVCNTIWWNSFSHEKNFCHQWLITAHTTLKPFLPSKTLTESVSQVWQHLYAFVIEQNSSIPLQLNRIATVPASLSWLFSEPFGQCDSLYMEQHKQLVTWAFIYCCVLTCRFTMVFQISAQNQYPWGLCCGLVSVARIHEPWQFSLGIIWVTA